jgi:hypothetical protein
VEEVSEHYSSYLVLVQESLDLHALSEFTESYHATEFQSRIAYPYLMQAMQALAAQ